MHNQLETIAKSLPPDAWLGVLPSHQRRDFLALMKGKNVAEVAELWILSTTNDHTNPFGARRNEPSSGAVWQALRTEMCRFLRGHDSYTGILERISKDRAAAGIIIVSLIANAIAKQIDVNSALISPVVAVLIYSVSSVGVNTVCRLLCDENATEAKPQHHQAGDQ